MDTVAQGRRQRRSYYVTILASFALAAVLAVAAKWLTGALSVPPPTRGVLVAAAAALGASGGVVWAIVRYLRCPQCGAGDVLLAYYRPFTRRCHRCNAELA